MKKTMPFERPRQAVILAGGKGSRLGNLTADNPKPLVLIQGSPFIDYLLVQLKQQGFEEVLILVGYLASRIKEYCGSGSKWGLNIKYVASPLEAETGWRLKDALPYLEKHFLLMYCDNYLPIRFSDMWDSFVKAEPMALVTVYSNMDTYTSNNVYVDTCGDLKIYDPS